MPDIDAVINAAQHSVWSCNCHAATVENEDDLEDEDNDDNSGSSESDIDNEDGSDDKGLSIWDTLNEFEYELSEYGKFIFTFMHLA